MHLIRFCRPIPFTSTYIYAYNTHWICIRELIKRNLKPKVIVLFWRKANVCISKLCLCVLIVYHTYTNTNNKMLSRNSTQPLGCTLYTGSFVSIWVPGSINNWLWAYMYVYMSFIQPNNSSQNKHVLLWIMFLYFLLYFILYHTYPNPTDLKSNIRTIGYIVGKNLFSTYQATHARLPYESKCNVKIFICLVLRHTNVHEYVFLESGK